MEPNETSRMAEAHATVVNAGAAAAREGRQRTENPYDPDSEDWLVWRDGFEQQLAWLEAGRGEYRAHAGVP